MATSRKKRKARELRYRTTVRKVLMKIRKLESKAPKDMEANSAEYWYDVASKLSLAHLQIAADHLNRYNASDGWYGRTDLFQAMEDAIQTALIEKLAGLTS